MYFYPCIVTDINVILVTAYDVDSVNGLTVLRETLELLPKPNYNLLKYIRYCKFHWSTEAFCNYFAIVRNNVSKYHYLIDLSYGFRVIVCYYYILNANSSLKNLMTRPCGWVIHWTCIVADNYLPDSIHHAI